MRMRRAEDRRDEQTVGSFLKPVRREVAFGIHRSVSRFGDGGIGFVER